LILRDLRNIDAYGFGATARRAVERRNWEHEIK